SLRGRLFLFGFNPVPLHFHFHRFPFRIGGWRSRGFSDPYNRRHVTYPCSNSPYLILAMRNFPHRAKLISYWLTPGLSREAIPDQAPVASRCNNPAPTVASKERLGTSVRHRSNEAIPMPGTPLLP